jgi:transcriptional regulator with XRE-family HTH domain
MFPRCFAFGAARRNACDANRARAPGRARSRAQGRLGLRLFDGKGERMSAALAERLKRIREQGGIKGREVAQLLSTTPETVSRWRTGKTEPQPSSLEKLLILEFLVAELAEFYNPDEARLWLFAPHKLLGGDRPADRIQQGRVDDVRAIIAQLKDGAYV